MRINACYTSSLRAGIIWLLVLLISCQKNNEVLSSADTQNVNAESAASAYLNESGDIASSAVSGLTRSQYGTGGSSGLQISGLSNLDDRLAACAAITLTTTGTPDAPVGTISIIFNSCADGNGVSRNGQILINYEGTRWAPQSSIQIQTDLYRNFDHVEGNIVLTAQTSSDTLHLFFTSILNGGKVTFADGRFVTRDHNLTREWVRSLASSLNNQWLTLPNAFGSTSSATGMTKDGMPYDSEVTKMLVEKVTCRSENVFIPVTGTKTMTVNKTVVYSIDYGNSTCDNLITVLLGGKAKQIAVTTEGN